MYSILCLCVVPTQLVLKYWYSLLSRKYFSDRVSKNNGQFGRTTTTSDKNNTHTHTHTNAAKPCLHLNYFHYTRPQKDPKNITKQTINETRNNGVLSVSEFDGHDGEFIWTGRGRKGGVHGWL